MQPNNSPVITTPTAVQSRRRTAKFWYLAATVLLLAAVGIAFLLANVNNRRRAESQNSVQVPSTVNDSQFDADDIDVPPPADALTITAPAMEVHDARNH